MFWWPTISHSCSGGGSTEGGSSFTPSPPFGWQEEISMNPRPSLRVERLEDRCVPATFGVAWPDGMHLTLSFAPDGTVIAGDPSSLNNLLDPWGDSAAKLDI